MSLIVVSYIKHNHNTNLRRSPVIIYIGYIYSFRVLPQGKINNTIMNITTTMESFQSDGLSSSMESLVTQSSEGISNTTEDHNNEWFKKMEEIVSIVVPIFFSIVVLVGFIGNLLVVLVVTFNKQMRNTTNLLIMNLAVADLLFIVFCVPFSATAYAFPHNWPFGNIV